MQLPWERGECESCLIRSTQKTNHFRPPTTHCGHEDLGGPEVTLETFKHIQNGVLPPKYP